MGTSVIYSSGDNGVAGFNNVCLDSNRESPMNLVYNLGFESFSRPRCYFVGNYFQPRISSKFDVQCTGFSRVMCELDSRLVRL